MSFEMVNKVSEKELSFSLLEKINNVNNIIKSIDLVLQPDQWSDVAPYAQTVNVEDIEVDSNGVVGLTEDATKEEIEASLDSGIFLSTLGDGNITITCRGTKPTIGIPINITFGKSLAIVEVPDNISDIDSNKTINVILRANNWTTSTPYTQTVVVNGVTDRSNIVATLNTSISAEELEAAIRGLLVCTDQATNTITVVARGYRPTSDIPISVTFGNAMTVVADYNITNISSNKSTYAVLRADGWGDVYPYEQKVLISDMVDSDNGTLQLADTCSIAEIDAAARAKIIKKDQTTEYITVLATSVKPTIDIQIMIIYGSNLAIIESPTGGDSLTIPHDDTRTNLDSDVIEDALYKIVLLINQTNVDMNTNDIAGLDTSKAYTDLRISNLINSSGAALDTLKELADALGNDPNFAATIMTELSKKATKDLVTTAANGLMSLGDKAKLDGIQAGATNYTHPVNHPYSMLTGAPASLPANGGNSATVGGYAPSAFAAASHGYHVPTPQAANNAIFLRSDNNWAYVTPANIGAAPVANPSFTGNANFAGNITAVGTITASKVYNAVWNDLAEAFYCYDEVPPQAGDIVEISKSESITKASKDSRKSVGVVSDCFATLYGATEEEIESGKKIAVGVLGRIPVKIKGKCELGDLIVSDGDGIGIVNNEPKIGTIVGKALNVKLTDDIQRVLCLVYLS